MKYIEMTPAQRQAKYEEYMEAVMVSQDCFALRPYRGSYWCRKAKAHEDRCAREAAFILRIAKARGDEWVRAYR